MGAFWKRHRAVHIWALLVAALFGLYAWGISSREAANAVSAVTQAMKDGYARLWYRFPFSVVEWFYVIFILTVIVWVVVVVIWAVKGPDRGHRLYGGILGLACLCLTAWGLYCVLWGVNYYADGFQEKSGIYAQPVTVEELERVATYFAENVGELADQVERDENGVFAVDEWARCQGLSVIDPQHIKLISGKLLAGDSVKVYSPYPIEGECPIGVEAAETLPADVAVSIRQEKAVLSLAPKTVVLGVGCRKATPQSTIESVLERFLQQNKLHIESICAVASIDLKKEEPGLIDFCHSHGWDFKICTAEELRQVAGEFTPSAFVSQITGVENVCERSAVFVSGGGLLIKKFAADGVTMAAAEKPFRLDWNWNR